MDKSNTPNSKINGANMGLIWGRQDLGGPRVGPMNLAIWDTTDKIGLKVTMKFEWYSGLKR